MTFSQHIRLSLVSGTRSQSSSVSNVAKASDGLRCARKTDVLSRKTLCSRSAIVEVPCYVTFAGTLRDVMAYATSSQRLSVKKIAKVCSSINLGTLSDGRPCTTRPQCFPLLTIGKVRISGFDDTLWGFRFFTMSHEVFFSLLHCGRGGVLPPVYSRYTLWILDTLYTVGSGCVTRC